MDRSIFICVSSFEDSVSSFVSHDLLEVCLLSQRSDLLLSAPFQNGIRFLQPPLPAASTAYLAAQLAPRGRSIGLILFRLNDTNDVVPACTPAAFVSVCSECRWKHSAACLLARACQCLWLCGDDGACGSSHVLDISFSLPLSPLRRLQCGRTSHGILPSIAKRVVVSTAIRPSRYQPRRCR